MDNWWIKVFAYTMATIIVLAGVFMFCAVVSLPFWLLWNWLIPNIFGLPEINWLQATGLWLMLALLNTLGFNYTKTLQTTRETIENNPKWDDIFLSIKKNYTA